MHCSNHLLGGHGDGQLHCSSSDKKLGMPASDDDLPLHDDGSPDMTSQSSYSVCLASLDNAIAGENYKKITLLSNVEAISEMLEEVELNEAKTKLVVSEASQAGNDILVNVEKLKEMSALAVEENNKVAGEVFAEKSILASEALGLQARLSNISEERNNFVLIIDEMHHTLLRRLAATEAERAAAEKEKIERETLAQKSLEEEELLLDLAKEECKKLEQQAQENAKLRESLMDRGHVVDALHEEMLGIFDNIAQLQQRVDMRLPVHEPLQLASSSLPSSVNSTASKSSWSSASESNTNLNGDEKIADASHDNFALDDSWDVVEDESIVYAN